MPMVEVKQIFIWLNMLLPGNVFQIAYVNTWNFFKNLVTEI